MQHATISVSTYVSVLAILLVLTVLTVGVSFIQLPPAGHVIGGLAIAVLKAALVVLFFMHAILHRRLTWIVIAMSTFWLVMVLTALAFSDYVTRGLVPFMPGH